MNIVIAGGQTKADFLISMFSNDKHHIVVINDNDKYSNFLMRKHHIEVLTADPSNVLDLKQANIENYDIIVALCQEDAKNLAICQIAKKLLHIKKTVAAVNDPKNVAVFKRLGVDTAISATFLISKYIEKASILENMTRSIVSEYDSLAITTISIQEGSFLANHLLSEVKMPAGISLGAVMRGEAVIVPNGSTMIYPDDKILIITPSDRQAEAIELINSRSRD